jgi:hypothetical protein
MGEGFYSPTLRQPESESVQMADQIIRPHEITPALIPLESIRNVLRWYKLNVCDAELRDPRGYRVRFLPENFIHLIKLRTKFDEEPKNARLALEEIERGRIQFVGGRFDPQRAPEISWIPSIATEPLMIVPNWVAMGRGDEAYIKNFGTVQNPIYRVLVCEIVGTLRQAVTVFPRERLGTTERARILWP